MAKLFFNNFIVNNFKKNKEARYLSYITLGLIIIGISAVSSCSSMVNINAPLDCITKHFINIGLGFILFIIASFFNYKKYTNFNLPLFIVTTLLLLSTSFFREINGAHRWINLGFFNFQPSELAKLVIIIIMANFLSRHKHHINTWSANVFPCIYLIVFASIIYGLQSDLGTTILLFVIWSSMLFIAKIDTKRILILILIAFLGMSAAIIVKPYRRARVITYVNQIVHSFSGNKETAEDKKLRKKIDDARYNSDISFAAFGSGGLTGKGAGKSDTKLRYLPEKQTDYIFPIIGEEYGLLGTLLTVFLFILFTKTALSINSKCKDDFGKFLSFGIMLTITGQAIINMGMTTGIFPSKGIPLPFISYGGSAMLINCYMIGILINIARNNNKIL
ncbi:FtsW/RodA/SpoVE family cell cycle protein [Candidatus Ruminimicrobiellum ovillum]|uniref:FtsW/RodA/SpoVE family cell cycle protein n=1 Tax=Candidatus Ruminimicrobiellum ovillum TaxID=1947927 RepID=UPI0035597973